MRRLHAINYILYLIGCDVLLTLAALHTAYLVRVYLPIGVPLAPSLIPMSRAVYVAAVSIWLGIFLLVEAYNPRKTLRVHEELQRLSLASGLAALTFAGFLYLTVRDLPRLLFIYFVLLNTGLILGHRAALRLAFRYAGPRVRDMERVLIVGAGALGRMVARQIRTLEWTGLKLVGFIDDDVQKQGTLVEGIPVLGRSGDIVSIVRNHGVDEVIFALPLRAQSSMADTIRSLYTLPVSIRVVPDLVDLAISKTTVETFEGIPFIGLRDPAIDGFNRLLKRAMDIVLATLLLLIVWPLMVVIAIAIKVTSPDGPVLFKQPRVGENGRIFKMYKFRTMVPDAEAKFDQVVRRLPDGTVIHKHKDDPRVLPIGRILRRLSLDELPQLFNVLKGEMSLVGPRPEIPQMMEHYKPWQWKRFSVPPGITGWWQVSGRADKPMHLHTEYDLYYIQHYSLLLDIQILWRTIWVVLRGKGAY